MIEGEGQSEMAKRKDRKLKAEPRSKQRRSKLADECKLPSRQDRLSAPGLGHYQVVMGTGKELLEWLKGIPKDARLILLQFADEASYKKYGPIYWQLAQKLPEIAAEIRRRRFEKNVDALTEELLPKA